MAIFNTFVVVLGALMSIASAVPMNLRRDLKIVTEIAYTTVDVAVKLIVDEAGNPVQTIVSSSVAPLATTTVASVVVSSSVPVDSPSVATTPSTTLVTVVPTTTVQPTTTAAPPASSSTVAAAAPSSSSNASSGSSAAVNAAGIVASSTNSCTGKSDACLGDITHYDGGQSACGPIVDTNSAMAIALPFEFMGTKSNDNPYCGRTLTVYNPDTGVQVQAYVADKCMGCTGRSIDLTNALFNAVAPSCDGRCHGFEWWFN